MASQTLPFTRILPDGLSPTEVSDLILSDPRWEIAKQNGLKEVRVLFELGNTKDAVLDMRWESPESAVKFFTAKEAALEFTHKGRPLFEITGKMETRVSPTRFVEKIH